MAGLALSKRSVPLGLPHFWIFFDSRISSMEIYLTFSPVYGSFFYMGSQLSIKSNYSSYFVKIKFIIQSIFKCRKIRQLTDSLKYESSLILDFIDA